MKNAPYSNAVPRVLELQHLFHKGLQLHALRMVAHPYGGIGRVSFDPVRTDVLHERVRVELEVRQKIDVQLTLDVVDDIIEIGMQTRLSALERDRQVVAGNDPVQSLDPLLARKPVLFKVPLLELVDAITAAKIAGQGQKGRDVIMAFWNLYRFHCSPT